MSGAKRPDGLTDKQARYAEQRAAGKSKTDSYLSAYNAGESSRRTAYRQARELETGNSGPMIAAYIERLREQAAAGNILKSQEIAAALSGIAADDTAPRGDRLRALDLLNRMQGAYIDRRETVVTASVSMESAEKAALEALAGFSGD